ncbi:DNA polymerase III subunit beta [Williamwhitmania taraxaci]|uniref:Beta sliding clamp n=1 Tax=Williamwhitmania taraxaci TaxID=1640674 RepID=A0A1G6LL29_9BACT|nr:DNA polymerase III subunit beta [Williamwhitmania taraxaci]SDC43747.1 DNA polymerase-3 subunit beta [Williamwhitmania taraxaci]
MKFVVSSTELLSHLQTVSRVISNKNTLPILDHFLFQLSGNGLTITASDLETTLVTSINLENVSEEGVVAVPAKLLTDTLKEFSDQPLTFDVNTDTKAIVINSETGKFTLPGQDGEDFPAIPTVREDKKSVLQTSTETLFSGISKTLFATADDELRAVMNGIFIELTESDVTFVATDAHKLVRYKRMDVKSDGAASFILPKKPAALLKAILAKDSNNVMVEFDDKNAFFTLTNYRMICRLVEGTYPSYASVIPANNPNRLTIDRIELYNALKRVAVFSNQASNLVKLELVGNQLTISAQDLDFSISAYERLNCIYEGDNMQIGFKSTFLIEILSNLSSSDVVLQLSDPSRAGLILPTEKEIDDEDTLMLLMPMMING